MIYLPILQERFPGIVVSQGKSWTKFRTKVLFLNKPNGIDSGECFLFKLNLYLWRPVTWMRMQRSTLKKVVFEMLDTSGNNKISGILVHNRNQSQQK